MKFPLWIKDDDEAARKTKMQSLQKLTVTLTVQESQKNYRPTLNQPTLKSKSDDFLVNNCFSKQRFLTFLIDPQF